MTAHHFPIARLDLVAEVRRLRAGPMPHKQTAKMLLHHEDLRIVLVALREGGTLAPHHASTSAVIHVLEGRIAVDLFGDRIELAAGQMLALAPELRHSVAAIEDAAVMLTIARLPRS